MKPINIKEFENLVNHNYGTKVLIKLEGIISTKIEIENVKIKGDENNITIFDKKDETKNIVLNKHQIMKIEETVDGSYNIKFDLMQNAKVIVRN